MRTAARVNIDIQNNATFEDALQFGVATDPPWTFVGQTFRMDIQANKYDATPLLTLTSAGGEIVVDDATLRILHFNVPEAAIKAALPVAEYVHELVMIDGSNPAVRVVLMNGEFKVHQGLAGG